MHTQTIRSSFRPSRLLGLFDSTRIVRRDADDLIRFCGPSAYEAAELNALHEDLGLLRSPRPGHWGRVAREVARRSGRTADEPMFRFAA